MADIEARAKRLVRQLGPTCAFYAFINGIIATKNLDDVGTYKIRSSILDIIEKDNTEHTNIGEFFDINVLKSFLEKYGKELTKGLNANYGFNIDVVGRLQNTPDTFYLIPIFRGKYTTAPLYKYTTMHWIAAVYLDNKLYMVDSPNKISELSTNNMLKLDLNQELKGKYFTWVNWHSNVKTLLRLKFNKFYKNNLIKKRIFSIKKDNPGARHYYDINVNKALKIKMIEY